MMSLVVPQFYQKNGSPYPVCNGEGILIEIMHEGLKVARTVEFAGDPRRTEGNPTGAADVMGSSVDGRRDAGNRMGNGDATAMAAAVNLARVSFTVHKSGVYSIAVMVGGRHVKDSPFTRSFQPGKWVRGTKSGVYSIAVMVVCQGK